MAEYIEREALFKEFERTAWYNNADRDEIAEELLMQIPAADVAPVVHGKWNYCGSILCECQNCGEIYSLIGNGGKDWNYCPNCGAKMEAGGNG